MKENISLSSSFSVVIPLYNKEISIKSTIESVLVQSYPHFELIIVDDGSTDNSRNVVKSFYDNRIKYIYKENAGVSSARNLGIEIAQNEYVVFLDADDLWEKFTLETFDQMISSFNQAQVFITNYSMTGYKNEGSNNAYYVDDYYKLASYTLAKKGLSVIITGCIAVKRTCFDVVGNFKVGITNGEDVDMWLRLVLNFKTARSECVTTLYRLDAENKNNQMSESERKEPEKKAVSRFELKSSSEQMYNGLVFLFSINHLIRRNKYFEIFKLMIYIDWIVLALLYIIRVRIINKNKSYEY